MTRSYKQAVNVLKPSKARMAAIHAKAEQLNQEAKQVVQTLLDNGDTVSDLYRAACLTRKDNETGLDREIRVVLLGMVRRG